jgi:hypothetical protein
LHPVSICRQFFRSIEAFAEAPKNLQGCPHLDLDKYHFFAAQIIDTCHKQWLLLLLGSQAGLLRKVWFLNMESIQGELRALGANSFFNV